jgi:hypothetical protein
MQHDNERKSFSEEGLIYSIDDGGRRLKKGIVHRGI